ncbi:bifunctional serine/threonine-protein kinase/formylglycine-generating enzyme family protein [Lignipirellula cremea]|uniref:non-specific serine/threonine protein kinase n=1 Tax=Lignipirellula cremea TaxID=2528010 RepID=A0A518E0M7_9BACT|nr:bifunctional serine/threonine-protein kinase/formylglycine-generating enzyme family protein [Lignipirellula cremea]QDU97648.1 Serine/threonine-protein kinase PknB [Lignipirellula cremea]
MDQSANLREQLDLIADEFEAAWRSGERPRIEDYLERLSVAQRGELFEELLAVEVELRRAAGETVAAEQYQTRFSEHGERISRAFELAESRSQSSREEGVLETHSVVGAAPDETDSTIAVTMGGDGAETKTNAVLQFGRYRVEKLLGKGGFGEVYLAVDEELRRQVAVKVASRVIGDADADAYLSEARIVATLDHPHIVPVYDVGRAAKGQVYVVSKYIEGSDLAERLHSDRPLPRRSVELIATLADALNYAHTQGLVHRDVKPGNILLDLQGQAYLCDFGLALQEEQYGQGPTFAGTPAYMSPEQARDEGHLVDGRSDIYSLGVVLYELLTGQRPFSGGISELLTQVAHSEPKPPRQIDDSLPPELERITLKCLAKRASDRYTTAADLAEDLRAFLAGKTAEQQHEARIVPKGLRSFDASDSDFFLDLLPGARDRSGLPDSITFWKRRLEDRDPDQTFRVGLMYGPSGCGKSSLVKAGLLPKLAENVRTVYIEATANETETRLLAGLRKACPELPQDISLKEAIARLRLGQSTRASRKVVLIIDQFEQWLYARNDYSNTELADALRQCDGGNVQAVVMVRDDFWLAVSRLFLDLDIRLLDGENSKLVDLFDLLHARKVLAEFGRAFGRLPDNLGQLDGEQERFLDDAVTGLATDGKVISVRLALFSEMVKGKAWTPETLKQLGGISGVGLAFLEETFSASSAPPAHRHHQRAARAVLQELLPGEGTNIKGHWRSQQQLLAASGYASRERDFGDLLRILDTELRLITPTDPERAAAEQEASEAAGVKAEGGSHFQLTHDYLVPALREWLTRKQKETRRGRAELRLEERAALWNVKQENRYLPNLWEWANIRVLTNKRKWSAPQQQIMRKAARVHRIRGELTIGILLVAGVVMGRIWAADQYERLQQAVETLANAPDSRIPSAIDNLGDFPRSMVLAELKKQFSDNQDSRLQALAMIENGKVKEQFVDTSSRRLALSCGLAEYGEVKVDFLLSSLSTRSAGCEIIVAAFAKLPKEDRQKVIRRHVSWSPEAKAKMAIVALHLGESTNASEIHRIEGRNDPTQQTVFVHDVFPTWHGDLLHLADELQDIEDGPLRSGIALSIGNIFGRQLVGTAKDRWAQILSTWYQEASDSGTHSAAGWALKKVSRQPSLTPDTSDPTDRDWKITPHGFTMVRIPAGQIEIRHEDNRQKKLIKLTSDFWLSDVEVSVGLFQEFMDDKTYTELKPGRWAVYSKTNATPKCPAQEMSWEDAVLFCNWLTSKEQGRTPCYKIEVIEGTNAESRMTLKCQLLPEGTGYRLPTDAEWEYACRAETTTRFCFGSDGSKLSHYSQVDSLGTAYVGSRMCNRWGLFDMHGNVAEWVCDRDKDSDLRPVIRGGSFFGAASGCQSSKRELSYPSYRSHEVGFRVASGAE